MERDVQTCNMADGGETLRGQMTSHSSYDAKRLHSLLDGEMHFTIAIFYVQGINQINVGCQEASTCTITTLSGMKVK